MRGHPPQLKSWRAALVVVAIACVVCDAGAEEETEHAQRPECFSTTQTRAQIEAHRLSDPFASMRAAAEKLNGQPIGARLCRLDALFFYEISVLRHNGRIEKLIFDATTGQPRSGADHQPEH